MFTIGINKMVMYAAKTIHIKNILRHELAHYLNYLETRDFKEPHGFQFKTICQRFGWDEEISKATFNIINEKIEGDLPSEKLIGKVKKLINLAQSSNPHEAELATIKANNLILAHNLERLEEASDEFTYHQKVLSGKKVTGKVRAIYEILKEFYVYPVFSYGKFGFYLEIIGSRENVEVAEYIAQYLNNELENIWEKQKLSGSSQKNSFMDGLCEEFIAKLKREKEIYCSGSQLIKINEELNQMVNMVYPRLTTKKFFKGNNCERAKNLGKMEGANLKIRKGLLNKKVLLLS
jgi:hypothetical protein